MNAYVIVLTETYDQYDILVPHPFFSYKTQDELQQELIDFYNACQPHEGRIFTKDFSFCKMSISLGMSGLLIGLDDVSDDKKKMRIPPIFTVHQWVNQYRGKRYNRGEI